MTNGAAGAGGRAEHVSLSAMRYRTHAPLIDLLMQQVGLSCANLKGLVVARSSKYGYRQSPGICSQNTVSYTGSESDY